MEQEEAFVYLFASEKFLRLFVHKLLGKNEFASPTKCTI